MLLFAPLVFIGVGYYKGEDPLATVKEMVATSSSTDKDDAIDYKSEIKRLEKELEDCRNSK